MKDLKRGSEGMSFNVDDVCIISEREAILQKMLDILYSFCLSNVLVSIVTSWCNLLSTMELQCTPNMPSEFSRLYSTWAVGCWAQDNFSSPLRTDRMGTTPAQCFATCNDAMVMSPQDGRWFIRMVGSTIMCSCGQHCLWVHLKVWSPVHIWLWLGRSVTKIVSCEGCWSKQTEDLKTIWVCARNITQC